MLRGELHNRGSAGRCEACGEIFPCPTGLAIYEAVKRELQSPTPAEPATSACEACGHAWKWHTSGGMCAGVDGHTECHCVMIREHPTPREAMQAGASTVDALLADHQVREGLDHESRRFCYRGWLAGEGRRKPETDDTRRAMAALLLELFTRP